MKRGMLTAMLMMFTLGVNGSTYPFKTGSGMNPNYRRPEKKKQEKIKTFKINRIKMEKKIFVFKYALTKGIIEVDTEIK